LTQDLARQLVE
jgi:hypothetical protein